MNPTDPNPATKPDLETDHEPPCWEWDIWEAEAIERGMSKELACLGRSVIREAGQHAWCPQLRCLCSEEVLEPLFRRSPELAKRLFAVLLETDGLRFAVAEDDPRNCEMIELAGFEESSNW